MSHYDAFYEAEAEEARNRRSAEIDGLIATGAEWLDALRRAGTGKQVACKVEEALFWLTKQTYSRDRDGAATAAANGDLPAQKGCQARPSPKTPIARQP